MGGGACGDGLLTSGFARYPCYSNCFEQEGQLMNRIARAATALIAAFALAGCSSSSGSAPDVDEVALTQKSLTESLVQGGREVYGGVAGSGGNDQSARFEIPSDRRGLSVLGLCSGGEGTALLSINGEGPFDLLCNEDGPVQEITDSFLPQGIRLLITIEGVPAGATWAVAAADTPSGLKD
jgi:hypothetical protein